MTIFNLDGAAIFGPGSEWLWTMAQFVALAVTGLAIYRQLRAQAWANQFTIFSQWSDEWRSHKMVRMKVEALMAIAKGSRPRSPAVLHVGDWLDSVAEARYNGHVRPKFAHEQYGLIAQLFWAAYEPLLTDLRKDDPTRFKSWERWVVELREIDRKAGTVPDLSAERVARWVAETIDSYIAEIRIEQEMKDGAIPTRPIAAVASTAQADQSPLKVPEA